MIRTYNALANQNIYDICLMTYGTYDQLMKLISDNNFGSLNNYPYAGQSFLWDDTLVFNQQVNISNSLANLNYATRSSTLGNIEFNIQNNGLPVVGNPIISPAPIPTPSGDAKYDYYIVFNSDGRWSNSTLTFTDNYLKGKSGYAVYAQQLSQFFSVNEGVDIHYDSVAGTFQVLTAGFELIDGYYLVVYPNKYDTTIP